MAGAPNFGMPLLPEVGPRQLMGPAMPEPAAPSFASAAAPPAPPAPPAPVGPGLMPMNAPAFQQPPMRMGSKLAMIAAVFAGIKDPYVLSAAVAGLQRARDKRRAMAETQEQTTHRRAMEQAEFYQRAMQNAAQFDDPVAFEQWRSSIEPMAKLHGVDPRLFAFSDEKKAAKDRRLMADAVDMAVKRHGEDILNQDNVTIRLADGRGVTMRAARQAIGGTVTNAGQPVPVRTTSPFRADNPNELKIRAFAASVGKKPEELTAVEIQQAIDAGVAPKAGTVTPGSFEDYMTATPERKAEIEKARGGYFRADDKASTADQGLRDINRQIAQLRLEQMQSGGAAAMTDAQQRSAKIISDDYDKASKDYVTRVQAYQAIDAATKTPSAAGDLTLIFSFMKMLDPNSTVREGEAASAQNAAGVPERIVNIYNKALTGERLGPSQRADFVAQAKAQMEQARTRQRGIMDIYRERARGMNVPEKYAVIDYDKAFGIAPRSAADKPRPGALPTGTTPAAAPKPSVIKSITQVTP